MAAQIMDIPDVRPDIRVQIDATERRHIGLIITAQQNRKATPLLYLHLQIRNQGATDPAPLDGGSDNQGVQLSNTPIK
jgi:hypothetical protein